MTPADVNAALPWVVGACLGAMWAMETVRPLARPLPVSGRLGHLARNATVIGCGAALNIGLGFALGLVVTQADRLDVGLLQWAGLGDGGVLPAVLTFMLLDLLDYWRHRLHHTWTPLWRLHQVHHLDEAVDVTTGYLNHPLEMVPMFLFFIAASLVFGFDPLGYAVRLAVGMGLLGFHHSNVRLPRLVDRTLSWVTPTPATHRVHHARHMPLTDSNFGTIFTWWDRLFGTWRTVEDPGAIDTGLDEHPAASSGALLRHPFGPATRPAPVPAAAAIRVSG